jgi:hypothetical protein
MGGRSNGDPSNGDPSNGDPSNGDPSNGDPSNGDPSMVKLWQLGYPGYVHVGMRMNVIHSLVATLASNANTAGARMGLVITFPPLVRSCHRPILITIFSITFPSDANARMKSATD